MNIENLRLILKILTIALMLSGVAFFLLDMFYIGSMLILNALWIPIVWLSRLAPTTDPHSDLEIIPRNSTKSIEPPKFIKRLFDKE